MQTGDRIAEAQVGPNRRAVRLSSDVPQTAERFGNRGKAGLLRVGACLAITGNTREDEAGIFFL